jgi:NADH-quinone oxidoreductase subunit J
MTLENIGWWMMAILAVVCALGMVTAKSPIHSALWLVANFVSLAVIYLLLSAPVLFAIQMIVYAGAIMVLFLFVIMFFMAPSMRQWLRPPLKSQIVFGGVLVIAFLLVFMLSLGGIQALSSGPDEPATTTAAQAMQDSDAQNAMAQSEEAQTPTPKSLAEAKGVPQYGQPKALGMWMFQYYTLPFELTSILLLAALLGAVMLARDVHSEGREHVEETAPVVHAETGTEVAQ